MNRIHTVSLQLVVDVGVGLCLIHGLLHAAGDITGALFQFPHAPGQQLPKERTTIDRAVRG